MKIFNLGSLNIDRVFRVPHIVRPGETIASMSTAVFAGGKGANQSVALARAGAQVAHVGKVGADGRWLLEKLARENVDTRFIRVADGPTGQALIQVDDAGQNAIVLLNGANAQITPEEVDKALAGASADDWLLAQNETSAVAHAIWRAKEGGRRVAFNPAPFDRHVLDYPLEDVDLLCINEVEGAGMTGQHVPQRIVEALAAQLPGCEILLTLGPAGAIHHQGHHSQSVDACAVEAVDTTAAGDTFFGYYLAARTAGSAPRECLDLACRAAALCIARPGAMDSIPYRAEVGE
jgi:ribokinase